MVKLSIIIPSYNTCEMTIRLVKSIKNLKDREIIVVDNGSKDGTVREIRKMREIRVIENSTNLGFAKAINQGLKDAKGEFLLLLNSDTEAPQGMIEKMVEYLKNHPEVGVVGPQLRNSDGSIQPSGGYLPNLVNLAAWALFIDDLPLLRKIFPAYHKEDPSFYKEKHHLGWVTGAFFLTRREVVEKVGFFDESMFMYVEEIDWCKRVNEAGYKIIFNPVGFVTHYKGASANHQKAGVAEEFNGLKYFFKKHKSTFQQSSLRWFLKIGALGRILLFGIILKDHRAKEIYEKAFRLV